MDLFCFFYDHALFFLHKTFIDGLELCGIFVMFYQLFGLSFWRHPFTAEDQLVSKWCNATFLQICSDGETNSCTAGMAWGWAHFEQTSSHGLNEMSWIIQC